jgi:hypothetical protein
MHSNVVELVKLITSEIRTSAQRKERWAQFKIDNADEIRRLLELDHTDMKNPGTLIGFDIDDDRELLLLNYTGQAHNELHEVEGGWTRPLREMRGLVFDFSGPEPKMVSRGFEKFFNANELPENTYDALREKYGSNKFQAREKADGHMIEYFMHRGELCATTRGKFNTASADLALTMLDIPAFRRINRVLGGNLMTVVVELVTPETEVHVNYDGERNLYLLAAFDKQGYKYRVDDLWNVVTLSTEFTMPNERQFSLDEMIEEVNDRSVKNNEGWVMDFGDELIKFKYIDYIGMMVRSKLSHKYIMNCIRNNRLERMLHTLPEEVRPYADEMVKSVWATAREAQKASDHKVLYNLHSDLDGGQDYFRTCCRAFYRECVA